MHKASIRVPFLLALALTSAGLSAYNTPTHAEITRQAWGLFISDQPDVLFRLGLWSSDLRLGAQYFDVLLDTTIKARQIESFERTVIESRLGYPNESNSVRGYVMVGAIREDDNPGEVGWFSDPYFTRGIDREFNHFFDPVNNIPLSPPVVGYAGINSYYQIELGSSSGHIRTAPNWAAGTENVFDRSSGAGNAAKVRGSDAVNHFTIFDVHEYIWRALTGTRYSDGGAITPNGAPAVESDRISYWASALRAIGDVLHLNQDMAQPQHTRNEAHSGALKTTSSTVNSIGGEASYFERYMEHRTIKARNSASSFTEPPMVSQIPEANGTSWTYPIPHFSNYSDYWSTALSSALPGGKGLADFSNHQFFTAGNNLAHTNYQYPPDDHTRFTPTNVTVTLPSGQTMVQTYYASTLQDFAANDPNPALVKLSTPSIVPGAYVLDDSIYNDMGNQLVPRAISYSAGILDYMFRGKLLVGPPAVGIYGVVDHAAQYSSITQTDPASTRQGFNKIRATITNVSPNADDDMKGGTLTAVLRFRRNLNYQDDLSDEPNTPGNSLANIDPVDESGKRSIAEEVAVSTSTSIVKYDSTGAASLSPTGSKATPLILSRNVPTEFEFDFGGSGGGSVLPLNATDVFLQIIYRGQLGSGNDADAIVVATQDLSEPTYVNVYNGSDYIVINHNVYTRAAVAASQDLLAQVIPSCVTGAPGSLQLVATCFNPTTMSGSLDVRDPTLPSALIRFAGLTNNQFSQFVVLIDSATASSNGIANQGGVNIHNTVSFDGYGPCASLADPISWAGTLNELQYYPTGVPASYLTPQASLVSYPTLAQVRGQYATTTVSCIWSGDGSPPSPDNRNAVMSPLAFVYPTAVMLAW